MISRIIKTIGIVLLIIMTITIMIATLYASIAIVAAAAILFVGHIIYKTLHIRESLE